MWEPYKKSKSKRGIKSQRLHKSSRYRPGGTQDSSAIDSVAKDRSRSISSVRSMPSGDSGGTMLTVDLAEEQSGKMFVQFVMKIVFSRLGRIMMLVAYSLFGALMFILIEEGINPTDTEIVTPEGFLNDMVYHTSMTILNETAAIRVKQDFMDLVTDELSKLESNILDFSDLIQHNKELSRFDFWTSLFFSATVFTTVGYGHITPKTVIGQVATIFYAIVGIPLCLMVLYDLGNVLKRGFRFLWSVTYGLLRCPTTGHKEVEELEDEDEEKEFNLPPIVAIVVLLLYVFLGSFLYIQWERWDVLTAFYFIFITFSTVGFGDIVPEHPKFFMASSVYIFFGLSLVSMVINVFAELLQSTLEEARATVGIVEDY